MSMRVCAEPGCPNLQAETRCVEHRREREQQRGTRQQRGYDAQHDRIRTGWAPIVAAGNATCWRCGLPIAPTQPWDLGHDDDDRSAYKGPEHATCNRATSGRI